MPRVGGAAMLESMIIDETTSRPTVPAPIRMAPGALMVWALGYGVLRAHWAADNAPYFPPRGEDLVLFTGWGAVVLCLAAACVAVAVRTTSGLRSVIVAGYALAAAMLFADALLLLDVVNALIPGLGGQLGVAGFGSRAALFIGAVLVGASTLGYQRRSHRGCPRCGRGVDHEDLRRTPRWAYVGAYVAVTGCLIRLFVQFLAGFDTIPLDGGASLLIFEIGFLLAGTLLPLALVHSWGRSWPRWVPLLSGRRVPRWLVLGPGLVLSVGITSYFGVTLAQMVANILTGQPGFDNTGPLSQAFFWVAVPSYCVWGIGMGLAAIGYLRLTRPRCRGGTTAALIA